jgi:hypothetical protein
VKVPPRSKKTRFADAAMDSLETLPANPPAPVDMPTLVDPASSFTGTLQLLPSLRLSVLSSDSPGQVDLTLPHAAFQNLFTARAAATSQHLEWNATHEAASLALQHTETGRRLAGEMESYLMQEMMRVIQVVQGRVSWVRIEQFAPDIEGEWAATWNQMAMTLPPNLEDSGAEYSEEGYVQPLDADDADSVMKSKE